MPVNPLPCDLEAERCVLGTLLMADTSEEFSIVRDYLNPEDFSSEAHRRIWHAMLELHEEGKITDRVTIAGRLNDNGQLQNVGGVSYICELDGTLGTVQGIQQYADRVKEQSVARRAVIALQKLQTEIAFSGGDPDVLQRAESMIQKFNAEASGTKNELKTGDDLIQEKGSLDDFMRREEACVPAPFLPLDNILQGGLRPGHLWVLAGRPSWGKTSLALQWAVRAAKDGIGTVVFSLETPSDDLLMRSASQESRVSVSMAQRKDCPVAIRQGFIAGMGRVSSLPLFYDDKYNNSVSAMANVLRQHKAKGFPLGFVVIDYLQLMASGRRDNRNTEIGDITREIKKLLGELKIPGLILSQLRRPKIEGEEPGLSDLRESGNIEQDADGVMILHGKEAEKKEARRPVRLYVKKQRNGPLGKIHLSFDSACTAFDLGIDCGDED
jgi:replicative DNA helicase